MTGQPKRYETNVIDSKIQNPDSFRFQVSSLRLKFVLPGLLLTVHRSPFTVVWIFDRQLTG